MAWCRHSLVRVSKVKIVEHYDVVSPYYHALWGEHLHHGYWITGDESKEVAQVQLVQHLAGCVDTKDGSDILDIGCGMGATSLYLAKHFHASATGITISQVQVDMANKGAAGTGLDVKFLLMDAEDILWGAKVRFALVRRIHLSLSRCAQVFRIGRQAVEAW